MLLRRRRGWCWPRKHMGRQDSLRSALAVPCRCRLKAPPNASLWNHPFAGTLRAACRNVDEWKRHRQRRPLAFVRQRSRERRLNDGTFKWYPDDGRQTLCSTFDVSGIRSGTPNYLTSSASEAARRTRIVIYKFGTPPRTERHRVFAVKALGQLVNI